MDGQLEVDVISGFDLPGRDLYLKLQLDLLVRKTSVKVNKKGSLTEWNQKLVFNVPDISGYTVLRVMLMERNTFYSDNLLAGVEVPLDSVSHGRMCVQDYGLTQQKGGGLHTLQLGLCWRGRDMERKNRDAQAKNQSEKQHTPERKNSVRTEETLRRVSNMSGAQVQKMTGSHKQNEHLAAKKQALVDSSVPQTTSLMAWVRSFIGSKDPLIHSEVHNKKKAAFEITVSQEKSLQDLNKTLSQMRIALLETQDATTKLHVHLNDLPALTRAFATYENMPLTPNTQPV